MLPPSFTYRGSILLGRKLRALCLETELVKKKKRKGAFVRVRSLDFDFVWLLLPETVS